MRWRQFQPALHLFTSYHSLRMIFQKKMHISPQRVMPESHYLSIWSISYHWHQGYQQRSIKLPEDSISSNPNKSVHPQTSLLVVWSSAADCCQRTVTTSKHSSGKFWAFSVGQHLIISFKYPSHLDLLRCSCSLVHKKLNSYKTTDITRKVHSSCTEITASLSFFWHLTVQLITLDVDCANNIFYASVSSWEVPKFWIWSNVYRLNSNMNL